LTVRAAPLRFSLYFASILPVFSLVNVQLNNVSGTRKSLVVTLEPAEVDTEHKNVVGEFMRQARLPGFRPGHAPAAMVIRRFSKEISGEFKQKVVARAYREAVEGQKLDVLNIVNIEEGKIEPGQTAAITVTVDVRPEIALPDYVDLPTVVKPVEPTDAEVDSVIESLRGERADFKSADRPAQKGDFVKLGYEGTLDGKPISELAPDRQLFGKVPQTWEEVEGANEGHLPGLGRQLAGLKAGDKKAVQITFPPEFPTLPALAGKTADYALEIAEVRERVLPPIDDEFFKANQVENLEALKGQVRGNLKMQKEMSNRAEQRRHVLDALAAKSDFAAPQSLVDSETQDILRRFIEDNMRRGVPAEQFEKDKKDLVASARQTAEKRVKVQLLVAKVAEKEKITVTERDLDNFIYREALRTKQRPEKLAKDLARERARLRAAQESIVFDKAVDFLVSKAKVIAP
jgi:trigger factor